jgi:hypothetical protein
MATEQPQVAAKNPRKQVPWSDEKYMLVLFKTCYLKKVHLLGHGETTKVWNEVSRTLCIVLK